MEHSHFHASLLLESLNRSIMDGTLAPAIFKPEKVISGLNIAGARVPLDGVPLDGTLAPAIFKPEKVISGLNIAGARVPSITTNSSMPILLKLYRCSGHGLNLRIWVGFYPQVILSLFNKLNVAIIHALLLSKSSNNSMPILLELYRRSGHGQKMCMLFGYNAQIIFVTFVHKLILSN